MRTGLNRRQFEECETDHRDMVNDGVRWLSRVKVLKRICLKDRNTVVHAKQGASNLGNSTIRRG